MTSSINSGPDVDPLKILDEVAEAVDPTGIYGMVKGWVPPKSCDDAVYLDGDIPAEEEGLPESAYVFYHGAQILLRQPDANTYLGVCGNDYWPCDGSSSSIFGYPSPSNPITTWTVEREGNYIHLKQAIYKAYLGFCGNQIDTCDGSIHGVLGFNSRSDHRTKFAIEQSGDYYHLKQVENSYLGMCGASNCHGSLHNVFGYSSKKSRTRWQVYDVTDNVGWEEVQTD